MIGKMMSRRQREPLYGHRLGPDHADDVVDPGGPADDGGRAAACGRVIGYWFLVIGGRSALRGSFFLTPDP